MPVQYIIDVMPQSLSKVVLHIIFSTKDREPWLDSDVRTRVHADLATICRDLGAELVHVGGVADHSSLCSMSALVGTAHRANKKDLLQMDQDS